jgi:plastocyanin
MTEEVANVRATLRALLVMAALALAGCGGTQMTTVISTVGEGSSIAAANSAFDRAEIVVPAGQAVSLTFENRDTVPHNVAIYADASATEAVFVGDIFSGPGSTVYAVPALPAGSYLFRCDVHQEMRGTVVATP